MSNAVHVLAERRMSPRFAVDHRVDIQAADGMWRQGRLQDVSVDGARIHSRDVFEHTIVRLKVTTGVGDIAILARVIRCTDDGVAVEYVEMTIEALTRYSRWLETLSESASGAVTDSS